MKYAGVVTHGREPLAEIKKAAAAIPLATPVPFVPFLQNPNATHIEMKQEQHRISLQNYFRALHVDLAEALRAHAASKSRPDSAEHKHSKEVLADVYAHVDDLRRIVGEASAELCHAFENEQEKMRRAASSEAKAERNKRIFELRERYGLTHAAIAERLGLSTSCVTAVLQKKNGS
jgi:DNA-directed RNA polymerase specialized sigma subunit